MNGDDYWYPEYGNASRPGLISDGSEDQTFGISTMRNDYQIPKTDVVPKGRRKQLLRNFFWGEFAKKYVEELSRPQVSELDPPDSNYRETFNAGGFKVKDNLLEDYTEQEIKALEDAIKIPVNTYYFMLDEIKAQRTSHNPYTVFRQSSKFSKPWYAPLE